MGGGLQKREHVAPHPEEQVLGRNRAVLDALVPRDVNEAIGNGASTNGVLQIEFVLPSRAEQEHMAGLLHKPGRNRIEIVDAADGHLGHVLGHGDGLGPIGGGQGDRLAHQLIRQIGAGGVAKIKALHNLSIALGSGNAPFGLKGSSLFHRRDRNDPIHAIGQTGTDGRCRPQHVDHDAGVELILVQIKLLRREADFDPAFAAFDLRCVR